MEHAITLSHNKQAIDYKVILRLHRTKIDIIDEVLRHTQRKDI